MSEESDTKLESTKLIQNMKSVLKNNSKFYSFLYLGSNQKKLLAEGNTLKSVEKESIKKIIELVGNDMDKLKKFNKKDVLFIFHLRKPNKEEAVNDKNSLDGKKRIGGRIGIFVNSYSSFVDEENKKNPLTIKNLNTKGYGLSSKYWANDRYLKKYDFIDVKHMKRILDVLGRGSPFAVRKLTDVIMKELPLYLTT